MYYQDNSISDLQILNKQYLHESFMKFIIIYLLLINCVLFIILMSLISLANRLRFSLTGMLIPVASQNTNLSMK